MSNVHLFKSMDSLSNSSFQKYSAAGSSLLEEVVSELLEETVSELLEDSIVMLLEDAAELSITLSLELERRFPLEAGMTYADGDASSEHAAKQAIKAAHPIATNL